MLAAGIVGVADAAVAIAVVDAVLAPDLTLADVNAFFSREEALIFRIHKTGDQGLRAIAVADHVRDKLECVVDGDADLFAGVIHGREVAAGDEGDLVTIAIVIGSEQAAGLLIFGAGIVEREPADGPGHFAVGAAAGEGFAAGTNVLRGVEGGLILTDGAGGRDFNLVDADDGDVGEEASSERGCGGGERRKGEGGGGAGGAAEEISSSPERVGHNFI